MQVNDSNNDPNSVENIDQMDQEMDVEQPTHLEPAHVTHSVDIHTESTEISPKPFLLTGFSPEWNYEESISSFVENPCLERNATAENQRLQKKKEQELERRENEKKIDDDGR